MCNLITLVAFAALASSAPFAKRDTVKGFDISHCESSVDFSGAYNDGSLRFVYIKATEGTDYKDPAFSDHYTGATNAGFIRGGYHFAHGDESASDQAKFFAANGGGWTNDGRTLPGMLDLENNCATIDWIKEFSDEYHSQTGRYPVLYSSPSWWEQCTGNSNAFVNTNPLDMACWDSEPCDPQGSWPYWTFWQYADTNSYYATSSMSPKELTLTIKLSGGDSDEFNGDLDQLKKLATG